MGYVALAALNNSWPEDHDDDFYLDRQLTSDQAPSGPQLPPPEEFAICGRTAKFHQASWPLQQKHYNCPKHSPNKKTLLLKKQPAFGRSGNRLRSFLRAVQFARDKGVQLGVMHNSWATKTIRQFFMADDGNWKSMEQSLCIKMYKKRPRRRVVRKTPKQLFYYKSKAPKEIYAASQLHIMRTLFQHYNAGVGHNGTKVVKKNMCSGINALFTSAGDEEEVGGEDHRSLALYSAIHLRSFEGTGKRRLKKSAKKTKCDKKAASEMKPEYVKSILAPIGMLAHPIVIVSDNQKGSKKALDRLLKDPEIGPMVRVVPKEARWKGGDMTLAVMVSTYHCILGMSTAFPSIYLSLCGTWTLLFVSEIMQANVFIGHPSSTLSGFIAKSRAALGFGHSNYVHLAKDKTGKWKRVYKILGGYSYM